MINYYEKIKDIPSKINRTSSEIIIFFIKTLNLNIKITKYSTYLDNSYSINQKVIMLSNDVINSTSVADIAISMHELGHALQHREKSALFYLFLTIKIFDKISSFLFLPSIIFFLVSIIWLNQFVLVSIIILLAFYLINLFSRLIIIPLERNASNRAIKLLKDYQIFDTNELKIAKKLLSFACLTYVGGFFKTYKNIIKKILKNF